VGSKAVWILWDIERLFLDCPARTGDRGTILRCSSPQGNPCTSVATDGQVIRMEVSVSSALILSYLGRYFGAETTIVLGLTQTCKGFINSEPIFYFQYGLFYELLTVSDHIVSTVGWFGQGTGRKLCWLITDKTPAFTWTGRGLRPLKTPILDNVVTSTVSSKSHPSIEQTYLSFDLWNLS